MNISIFINLHPKSMTALWSWLPKVAADSWTLNRGGKARYFTFQWLFFGFQLDNEW